MPDNQNFVCVIFDIGLILETCLSGVIDRKYYEVVMRNLGFQYTHFIVGFQKLPLFFFVLIGVPQPLVDIKHDRGKGQYTSF